MSSPPNPHNPGPRLAVAIVLVSVAMLMFEIWQTITLSVQTLERNAFLVVSLCLLGLGGGGSIATWLGRREGLSAPTVLWRSAMGFAVVAVLASMASSWTVKLPLLIILGVVPYLFVGVFLSFVFRLWPERANKHYFLNLIGSGLGCLALVWVIGATADAALTLVVIATVALAGAATLSPGKRQLALAAAILVSFATLAPVSGKLFRYPVAPEKGMAMIQNDERIESEVEWTRWDYLGRLDVLRPGRGIENFDLDGEDTRLAMSHGAKVRYLFASGGNWTRSLDFGSHPRYKRLFIEESPHSLPYLLTAKPDVLNIGFGGGVDIFLSLAHGAQSVVGVDINPLMIEAGRDHLTSFFDDFHHNDRVEIMSMDGRAYVRNTERKFDIVSLTAVDTGELLHSNAHVLLENYLYTHEAFEEYFSVLREGGFLYISRPHLQMMRGIATAVSVLRARGATNPAEHMIVLGKGEAGRGRWRSVVIGAQPLTDEQMLKIRDRYPKEVAYSPRAKDSEPVYRAFFTKVAKDQEVEFMRTHEVNFMPVYDDRPFFYEYGWTIRESPAGRILFNVLLWVGAIAIVLILLPLRGGLAGDDRGALLMTLAYFASIGAGFMFIEISLIQKLVLFLGHPSYSVTVTLFAILISSGLGSIVAARLNAHKPATAALIWLPIIAAAVFYAIGLGTLLPKFNVETQAARNVVAGLLLAPGSFFMGMPFPTMIKLMGERHAAMIPWAWAVNAFTSVVASVLTVLMAMQFGFTTVLYMGAAFYILALIFYLGRIRRPAV